MELVSNNKRRVSRQKIYRPTEATLVIHAREYSGQIVDYTLEGFGVRVERGALKNLKRDASDVQLRIGDQKYSCRVSHTRPAGEAAWVGIHLPDAIIRKEISFTSEDPGWDLIEDQETISNIFSDLIFKGPEVLMELRQLTGRGVLIPQKLQDENHLIAEIHAVDHGNFSVGLAACRFEMFQTCHAFETRIVQIDGKSVQMELSKTLARLLRRETVRVANGTNEKNLQIKIESELLGKSPDEVTLLDYSEHGLSILDPTGWMYAPIDTPLERITITTNSGQTIHGRGVVRGYRWISKENLYAVGIHFETSSDQDRTHWHNAILEARYLGLSFDYKANDHKEIWGLFDRSGYLDLQDREAFSHVIDVTKSTWEKLSNAGTKLSKRAMIRKEGQIVGHLQMDRIYPDTWCAHHLAIDPKTSRTIGRELYSVTADVLSSEGARYILSITQASKPWNQRNYYDFVKNYRFPEQNELRNYQLYEVDLKSNWNLEADKNVNIRAADRYDHQRIAKYFEIYGTDIERKACCLTLEDLNLSRLDRELSPHGMSRAREFFVAIRDNKLLGFARIETGTQGVNIWGLQDTIYIHTFPELGSAQHSIHETLVKTSLERMRELERDNVIMLLDDGRSEYYDSKNVKYIWEAVRWIAMCAVSRRYHAFSQMLYGHLLLAREEIRKRRNKN